MRGFAAIAQAAAQQEARRMSNRPGAGALWFKLADKAEAVVRFLEEGDEVYAAMTHEVPVEGRAWGEDVPCLNQDNDGTPCPGCEFELPRRFKGWINLIWYDAPVYKRDDSTGRIVKDSTGDLVIIAHKDQIAIWSSGIRLFEELSEIDTNYHGLRSRPFRIKRKGTGIDTRYTIFPHSEQAQALTAAEQKLVKDKHDLTLFTTPPSYDEFRARMGAVAATPDTAVPANPFLRSDA